MADLRLAVFDLDGTLVDSQHMIVAAMARAYEAVGEAPPTASAVRRVVGLSLDRAIDRLSPAMDATRHGDIGEHYKEAFFALREAGEHTEELFPGVFDVLERLEAAGWLLGIATGKTAKGLHSTLDHFGLSGRFLTLQDADTGPGKPAPHMLERAMREVGSAPEETVMIGDTSFDMEMARAAGVAGIGVGWGYHGIDELLRAGALRVIGEFAELPNAASAALGEGDETA